jgi:hypothetical protein
MRDGVQIQREVADDRLHLDAWILAFDGCRGVVQRLLAHIERHEASEHAGAAQGVE